MALTTRILSTIVLTICLAAVGYYILFSSSDVIKNASSYIVYPVLRTQNILIDQVNSLIRDRRDSAHLKKLLEEMHQECESLRAENIQLHATHKYNDDIHELTIFRQQYALENAHIVHIIFRHFSTKEHYFLVDAGINHGIKKNMVAVYKNCLVGKVEQVYAWYSKIRLITDASCKVAAYCSSTKTNGIYQGCNDHTTASLHYVPHFQPITLNDLILSSGEGVIFPQGFSLGTIESYEPNGLHHSIRIKPHVNLPSLSYCILITR